MVDIVVVVTLPSGLDDVIHNTAGFNFKNEALIVYASDPKDAIYYENNRPVLAGYAPGFWIKVTQHVEDN